MFEGFTLVHVDLGDVSIRLRHGGSGPSVRERSRGDGRENHEDYRRAIHDPDTVHAMVEDYRTGLGVDREADEADKAAGRTVRAPTLVLWGSLDDIETNWPDPLAIWRSWADDLRGHRIASGHHRAEETPDEPAAELASFIGAIAAGPP